ncbi:hypothetical protein ARMGADRAFT_1030503 [Armillaria gallica]|uniref:Uncharacterized protein n=1 Tax=Armillaria gallica TaxID=47427 RepID=A0A2H3DXP3_ARMGA|nr:hypothetical protein ARMGADRAFT_1030503 [Armillaria gallica]
MSLSGSWTIPTRLPFPHLDNIAFSQPKLKYNKAPQLSHMLPEDLMPSKIRGDPKLLLHNSAAGTSNGPFDSKYGTILDGQDSFIVTPNSSIMPRPPIGAQHEVYMVAPEGAKALCPLFHGLTNYNFVECDNMAIVKGVGRLCHPTFLRLQSACQAVIDSPLMEAPESDTPSMPIDDTLVGAFSNDATIIQRFSKAGIPVWRIVTMKDLRGVHIDRLSNFTTPPFVDKLCPLQLPSVFVGSSRDPQKYHKIQDFTMHSICWVDPFALSTPVIMGQEDVPVSMSTISNARYLPYQKKASESRAKGTSHQLTDSRHPFLPPLVEPWRLGLLTVVADSSRCHSSVWPEASNPTAILCKNQYMFPCPDIIVTLNMEEKVKSYLVSWLHLRALLYARLTVTEQVLVNLYHQEWRALLAMGFLHSAGEIGRRAAKRSEECAPYIFAMKKMMQAWNGPCPALLDKVQTMGWRENEFLELEKTVAAHYADSFYLYFGHAPVLPCQLLHRSSEDYVPEVQARMSTSRSVSKTANRTV